jgi:hypothetical protein
MCTFMQECYTFYLNLFLVANCPGRLHFLLVLYYLSMHRSPALLLRSCISEFSGKFPQNVMSGQVQSWQHL